MKVTPEEEIITRTVLRVNCPVCKAENIVAFDDYCTDEEGTCYHYVGFEFNDDDVYEMEFSKKWK